ncbi:mRNA turnover protein 4 homolog [Varroa destructor]|uniref:Ribosome assembly factor mrt4 n=1 Tax=Varroa destructor TaxID=109461 RepID=A0A7M7JDZ3_VARDE|nr:mRNA turnover protein 4 homolog [Varroa destructor]
MPVSKRNRVISLTQAKKKGLEHKEKFINEVRDLLNQYESLYIFSVENMRNNKLKDVREEWKGTSKLIMGKNKVLRIALGRNAENEIAVNIHKVSERLIGQCGLLLTSECEDEVIEWFESYREPHYARAGFVATSTVVLKEDDLSEFVHSMEPQFRRLGLPTKLVNGKIKLLKDFTVCSEGDTLSPEMADVLKHVGIQMAEFHVTLEFVWRKDGTFKVLHENEERSSAEVKKSKAKHNKAKRFKKSHFVPNNNNDDGQEDHHMEQDFDGDYDDDESNNSDEENGSEEGDEVAEEEIFVQKKSKDQQKENRLTKKAKRTMGRKVKEVVEKKEDDKSMEEEKHVASLTPRRSTRWPMKVKKNKSETSV